MGGDWLVTSQFWQDGLGENLAQLNSHLVKGVDVPDCALGKYFVLVQGYQRAKDFRS